MRNVYLSVLGTSPYVPCNYETDSLARVENVRFVQEATLSLNCRDWTAEDCIFILTTEEAFNKNWMDGGHQEFSEGLQSRIERLNLRAKAESVNIPSGKTLDEIWEIFNLIYDLLNDDDHVIFDITHAFRSIPMLAIVVLNYAKVLKKINLMGIYYGAFEVLGGSPSYVEENIHLKDRKVPIFDLTAFNSLLEWSSAIHQFVNSGHASPVKELAESELKPILRDQIHRREAANQLKSMSRQLVKFSNIMATCRGHEIPDIIDTLKKIFNHSKEIDLIPPMKPLMGKIHREINRFSDNDTRNGIQAARWCLEHNMVQQGFTILQETFISCLVKMVDADIFDEKIRNKVNPAVRNASQAFDSVACHQSSAQHNDLDMKFMELFRNNKSLLSLMNRLIDCRNDINHAGYNRRAKQADRFRSQLEECINDAKSLIENWPDEKLPA